MKSENDIGKGYVREGTASTPLRVYRVARNMSQQELADEAGISRVALGALERGESTPRLATARALARVLEVSDEALWASPEKAA